MNHPLPPPHHHRQEKPPRSIKNFSRSIIILNSHKMLQQAGILRFVNPSGQKNKKSLIALIIVVAVATTVMVGWMGLMLLHGQRHFVFWTWRTSNMSWRMGSGSPSVFNDKESEHNAARVQSRREEIDLQCRHNNNLSSELLATWQRDIDQASSRGERSISSSSVEITNSTATSEKVAHEAKCPFAFFDFGANIGDSLGKFINVGMPTCGPANITTNRLMLWAASRMKETAQQLSGRTLLPEHYCYFGIEGNPVFTERLQLLGDGIMRTRPRPVRLAHFWTETVGAGFDGPTVLYLDTKNEAKNYWGSSLLYSHIDVQASANEKGQVYQAQVQGVTLSTLLRRHLVISHGSHAMIKIDIEGAEYALLNEAYDSGILCELTSNAIIVDLLVEVHSRQLIGPLDEMERFRKEVKSKLERECGVNLLLTLDAD